MSAPALHATRCAICGTDGNAAELYPATFAIGDFSPQVFSARRLPDRIHHRIVKCRECGLVRSDPVADEGTLAELYRQSTFDYGPEVANLRQTYGKYLQRLDALGGSKGSLLEIGCGNGFFLEEARARGYREVCGVEPGAEPVAQAPASVGSHIVCDMMRPGLFAEKRFDAVCLFQVFDHLADPAGILTETHRVLKSGGMVLILNHNVDAVSARILGERSPIIDIEHTYLYSPRTLSRLLEAHRFKVRDSGRVWNRYSLSYFMRLVPLPAGIKHRLLAWLGEQAAGRLSLSLPLGNLYMVGQKTND
jgi:SAM-dependent methyltransferase